MNEKELYDIYDEVNRLLINNEMGFDLSTVHFYLAKSLLLLKVLLENLIEINERSKKLD